MSLYFFGTYFFLLQIIPPGRRMVTLVVLRSGLGNPTDPGVVAGANTCLATVFPVSQLVAFQALVRIEKKTKIRQLTAVVKGLRIYNWDCGRGGAGEFGINDYRWRNIFI